MADFFCGAGGLSLGFEQSGFQTSIALDSDYWSTYTYRHNRRSVATTVLNESIEAWLQREATSSKVDVVLAGLPCQSFSNANRQRRADDSRHALYEPLMEAVARLDPSVVVIENVVGFRSQLASVSARLAEHGYATSWALVNAADFGMAQRRRRLVAVAVSTRRGPQRAVADAARITDGLLGSRRPPSTLMDAIGDLPPLKAGRVPNAPELETEASGTAVRYVGRRATSEYVRRINGGRDVEWVFNHKSRYNNDRDIAIFERLRPGDNSLSPMVAELMPYANRNHIFKDKYFRLKPNEVSRTVTAHMRFDCNMYVHPTQARGLTVREAARLQGFPDDYVFAGSFQRLYQQVGNAVPPPVAAEVGRQVLNLVEAT